MNSTISLLILTATLFAFLLLVPGCAKEAERRYVILILLDAARADRFSSYGYHLPTTPEMDKLAAEGVVFLKHFSHATHTRSSLPSMLYSRYFSKPLFPANPDVPYSGPQDLFVRMDDESISIPAAFQNADYRTCLISAHTWIQNGSEFANEFQEFHNLSVDLEYPKEQRYPSAEQVVDFAMDWVKENKDHDFLLYIHLMDTHFPHLITEDTEYFLRLQGASLESPSGFSETGRPKRLDIPLTTGEKTYLDALYDGSLRSADRSLGRLFSMLKSGEFRENTIVAITSDHGEYLLEQPNRFAHGGPWYDVTARVPMILYAPGKLSPQRVSALSQHVDLLPTLLDLSDVELPAGKRTDGNSLLQMIDSNTPFNNYVFSRDGVRSEGFKCIIRPSIYDRLASEELPLLSSLSGELYDLQADPGETANLWDSRPEVVQEMLRQYWDKLQKPYQRYAEAKTEEQPRSSFAIKASYFWLERPDDLVKRPLKYEEEIAEVRSRSLREKRWVQIKDREDFYLMGPPGCPPLDVYVGMPNGVYDVTAAAEGKVHFQFPDRKMESTLQSSRLPDFDELVPTSTERLSLGPFRVTDQHFRVRLRCDERHPFLVRHFGFTPVLPDGERIDDIDEEQLRALGYIQ